jgi:hypothetical protein
MLKLCNFEAWVSIDGKELEQYGVEDTGDQTVSCWIASEVGKVRCKPLLFQPI